MAPHCPCVLVQRSSHCCPMAILLPSHGCPLDSSGQPSPSRSAHPRFPTKPGAVSRVTSPHGMSPAPASSRRWRPAGPQGLDRPGNPTAGISRPTCRAITGPRARSPDRRCRCPASCRPELRVRAHRQVGSRGCNIRTWPKAFSQRISTSVFKRAASFRCWRHNSFAGSDSAFDPHDLWER